MGNDVAYIKKDIARGCHLGPRTKRVLGLQVTFILPAMSVTKDLSKIFLATIQQIKRVNDIKAEEHLTEIKKLKYNEPHKFKKRANEDQYKFNLKMAETIDSAKSAGQKSQLEKVKSDLEEGEKLLNERQRHILLADRSEFGWCTVDGYKQHDLADDSDDEKRIYSAERAPVWQFPPVRRRRLSHRLPSLFSPALSFLALRPCFACGKPGRWRACCPAMAKQSSPAPK